MGHKNRSMPRSSPGRLYLVGFTDGRIKVGRACHVEHRIKSYMSQHRDAFLWAHIFGGPSSADAEQLAVLMLAQRAVRQGRSEYFKGLEKTTAISICRQAIAAQLDESKAATACAQALKLEA
jgi:hypothetical protein